MKKVAVIGHFAFGKEYLDGQTVKTKVLAQVLCRQYGEEAVIQLDSHNWKNRPFDFLSKVIEAAKKAEHVVILPAHNGLKVLVPLLSCVAKRVKTKLHYAVVGGWLPKILERKKGLQKHLKGFAGIYVETGTMKQQLNKMGFNNVEIMRNCKDLSILQPARFPVISSPYTLCTFSRVMREKGIEDAIGAVQTINQACGKTVYTLDIYGPVDPAQEAWFDQVKRNLPEYIRYKGTVPYNQSVDVLKDYFALLFPTRFFTEGVPGTIIDAYAAGVPVISAKWESFADVIDEGKTGYGYAFGDHDAFCRLLELIAQQPEMVTSLKENCFVKAQDFTPAQAMAILLQRMEG